MTTAIPPVQGWWAEPAPTQDGTVIAPSSVLVLVESFTPVVSATGVNAAVLAPAAVNIAMGTAPGRVRFGPIARAPGPVGIVIAAASPGVVTVDAAVTAPAAVNIAVGTVAGYAAAGTVVHAPAGVPITVEALPGAVVSSRNATATAPAPVAIDVTAFAGTAVASTKAAPELANPSGTYKTAGDSSPVSLSHTPAVQDTITHYLVAINTIDYAASWVTPVIKVGSTELSLVSTAQYDVAISGSIGHLFVYQMGNPPQGAITFSITATTNPELRAAVVGFTQSTTVTLNDTFSGVQSTPASRYYGPGYPSVAQADCVFAAYAAGAPLGSVGRAGSKTITVNNPGNSVASLIAASVSGENLAEVTPGEFTYLTFNPPGQTNNAYCITMVNIKN